MPLSKTSTSIKTLNDQYKVIFELSYSQQHFVKQKVRGGV